MSLEATTERAVRLYESERHRFELFRRGVFDSFDTAPELHLPPLPCVHSIKSRLKDPAHLREKIARKSTLDDPITEENVFARVTDLCGVRVLHLHQRQFDPIHQHIQRRVDEGDWYLAEPPKAWSWDPEAKARFEALGLSAEMKGSLYTSVHYLVRPRPDSLVCCEIQVRTLFEELWGEIDHAVNYPRPSESRACRDQLKVLARLVSTGIGLADAIFAALEESASSSRPRE